MALRGQIDDPIRNFKFLVFIGDTPNARSGFSRVSGLKENTEVVEYREGSDAATPRKLFGQTTVENVTLERGLTNDPVMFTWRRLITATVSGAGKAGGAEGLATVASAVRRSITIDLIEYHGRPSWTWVLTDAWPMSLEIGEFAGDGNDVVAETAEFAHEGLEIFAPS